MSQPQGIPVFSPSIPTLGQIDLCKAARQITGPVLRGEDLWNEAGDSKVDGRDRIEIQDPVRHTVEAVTVDQFLSDPQFDRFGSPETRKELLSKALWKTPTGMRSGLPVSAALESYVKKIDPEYQTNLSVISEALDRIVGKGKLRILPVRDS